MSRQIGTAIGVSVFVALLGTPATYAAAHAGFRHGWWALAAIALIAASAAIRMSPTVARARAEVTAVPAA